MSSAIRAVIPALFSLLSPGRSSRYLSYLWILGALATVQGFFYTDSKSLEPTGRRSAGFRVGQIDGLRVGDDSASLWDKRTPREDRRLSLLFERAVRNLMTEPEVLAPPEVQEWEPEVPEDPVETWLKYRARR